MIQGLADRLQQPIAMFASIGPVKGMELTKIVLKAILLLENAEIQVMGITSDGAATNRSLWNALGVYGKEDKLKIFFENPYDPNQKVFIFSDAPHLLKTVRNRLFAEQKLRVSVYD